MGVAATEADILRDEQERSNLLKAISDVETAIAASTPGTRRVLENTVENAKRRIVTLDRRIEEAKVEHAAEVQAQATAAALAAKETKLNEQERERYRGFLEESFFTKKDFGKLENFYTHSYDRLSEDGKEEMSHRFWEGIRHEEYRFEDAPATVREKEAKLTYKKLSADSLGSDVKKIPASDRAEFLEAYRSGDQQAASHILSRDSFKQNMSLETSAGITHQAATIRKASEDVGILGGQTTEPTGAQPESSVMTKVKQTAAALQGIALVDTTATPTVADLPNALTPVNGRSPA